MKPYGVTFRPEAQKDLASLDRPVAQRILNKIKWLSENLSDAKPEALSANLKGFYKLRVGSYRAVYKLNDKQKMLTIFFVGHRREVYKRS